ncbi:MAG: hypothetical protein GY857_13800 [Desulfobacula sp.]|nr:hypothetical protein [Desulfobacula sp.]
MNVTCDHCKTKLTIPDSKIPQDRDSIFKCPKCKEKIKIAAAKPEDQNFDFFFEGQLNTPALVCIGDNDLQKMVYFDIHNIGFNVNTVATSKEALKKLEYHIFPLIILDETFDQNKGVKRILDKLNAIDMSLRRKICLVFISKQLNTNDDMSALHASVNSVINVDDVPHLIEFLHRALTDHKNFYTIYNASMKPTG